ncbi:MAG: MTH1187 family thiamine-binding protein [Candidatus Thorarchaeota archaeon]
MSGDKSKSTKVIAELVVAPFGVGTSLSNYVSESVKEIDEFPGIRVQHTPMSSIIEADSIEQILDVTKAAHERMFSAGAKRVSTLLRIDDRRDKGRKMEDKVDAISRP